MQISYQDTKQISQDQLKRLFCSVDWSSGDHPDKLAQAIAHYGSVFTAWDEERLVGLVSALDDGIMTAYVHYLLVDPEYQGKGIGRRLIERIKAKYEGYLKLVLISVPEQTGFYERSGFQPKTGMLPMAITAMRD